MANLVRLASAPERNSAWSSRNQRIAVASDFATELAWIGEIVPAKPRTSQQLFLRYYPAEMIRLVADVMLTGKAQFANGEMVRLGPKVSRHTLNSSYAVWEGIVGAASAKALPAHGAEWNMDVDNFSRANVANVLTRLLGMRVTGVNEPPPQIASVLDNYPNEDLTAVMTWRAPQARGVRVLPLVPVVAG